MLKMREIVTHFEMPLPLRDKYQNWVSFLIENHLPTLTTFELISAIDEKLTISVANISSEDAIRFNEWFNIFIHDNHYELVGDIYVANNAEGSFTLTFTVK